MKFADAPFDTLLRTRDRVGQDIRHMYYIRRNADDTLPGFVGAYGVATTQGEAWQSTPLSGFAR